MGQAIGKDRLLAAIDRFTSSCLLVVGDLMLDQFVWGEVSRISPEAPVPVVAVRRETTLLGGAANVANNLLALGSGCILAGIVGQDSAGRDLIDLAGRQGIEVVTVTDNKRQTTLKTRIIARAQQVVRVDRETKDPLDRERIKELARRIKGVSNRTAAIVVSDYAKGVINEMLMDTIRSVSVARGIPVFVDPKPGNMHCYGNVTVVTPNKKEAEAMSGISINDLDSLNAAAKNLGERFGAEAVLVTRGALGMGLWQGGEGLFAIPTMAREVFDVTGAGDTVIATMALGVANGLSYAESAYLANLAAGSVVGKVGTATVSRQELERLVVQELSR